jgi:hypothetical protein
MGYACPVCSDPQADATHLANHLAFTALTGGDDHETWLDDTVPEWGQLGETELAERVVDHAEQREFPQVFEESGADGHADELPPGADSHRGAGSMSDADAEVLAEARELTKEMLEGGDTEADADADDETTTDAEPDGAGAEGETQ